jgi:Bacterial membrane flanked domain.
MNSNLESILEPQEVIKWQGKMSRQILGFVLILSLILIVLFTVFLVSVGQGNSPVAFLISVALLGLVTLNFFIDYVKVFTITDKRIIIRSGIIGTDYNSIYFPQIRTASVKVDLIDKLFSVGSINIDTGKVETVADNKQSKTQTAYDKLSYIEKPYEVYKILEELKVK